MDWGFQSHCVCIVDAEGIVLGEKSFPHSGDGLHQLLDWILDCGVCEADRIAVAIEGPHGPIVDTVMERGVPVFAIHSKQLDRFRDRFSPAGAKDDRRDAHVLADAVRTDPQCLRNLDPMDSEVIQLREWSRMSDELTAQRTQLTHQVRTQFWRYFPQFLELKFPLYSAVLHALWTLIPTPSRARRVRLTSVEKVLKRHRIRRIRAKEVLAILKTTPLNVADGVQEAIVANLRLDQLALIETQLQEAEHAMQTLLETMAAASIPAPAPEDSEPTETASEPINPESAPGDVNILESLPGVGTKVLATLLSEASGLIKARDYQGLRAFCGGAPVTRQSRKSRQVVRRKAGLGRLSNAIYHWSRVAIQHDPVSKAKYDALRDRGHTHGQALRSVADRLLAVACAMLRDQTLYDPSRQSVAVSEILPEMA
ncbi:MAG: IS110 family transposase [Bacteroidota bacterium]|nr:IS110 family transposase [Bacteroidota bacterium]